MSIITKVRLAQIESINAKGGSLTTSSTLWDIKAGIDAILVAPPISQNAATSGDILAGKQADVNGTLITGTIPTITPSAPTISVSNGGVITASYTSQVGYTSASSQISAVPVQLETFSGGTLTPGTGGYTIPAGVFTTGQTTILGDSNLVASNIRSGVTIFGVQGSLEETDFSLVTITSTDQVLPGLYFYDSQGVLRQGTMTVLDSSDFEVSGNMITIPAGYVSSGETILVGTAKQASQYTPGTSNQVVSAGTFLVGDLTILGDSNLTPENIANGVTIFGIRGTHEGGTNTSDATALPEDVEAGKIFYNANGKQTGSLQTVEQPVPQISIDANGTVSASYTPVAGRVKNTTQKSSSTNLSTLPATEYTPGTSNQTIPSGKFLTGVQTILGDSNLLPENIRSGVTIFGVQGSHICQGVSTGKVKVTLDGGATGASWFMDFYNEHTSGEEIDWVAGTYRVMFKDVDGFLTPNPQIIQVVAGVTTSISATYVSTSSYLYYGYIPLSELPSNSTVSSLTQAHLDAAVTAGTIQKIAQSEFEPPVTSVVESSSGNLETVEGYVMEVPANSMIVAIVPELYEVSKDNGIGPEGTANGNYKVPFTENNGYANSGSNGSSISLNGISYKAYGEIQIVTGTTKIYIEEN